MIRCFFILLSVMALSGCLATNGVVHYYKGEPKAETQLATVILPEEIDIVAVNSRKRALPLIRNASYQIKLLPGLNELVLEYSNLWDLDSDNHVTVSSDIVLVSKVMKAGDVYEISVPKFTTIEEMKAYAKDFEVTMVAQSTGDKTVSTAAKYGVAPIGVSQLVPQNNKLVSSIKAGVQGESEIVVHGVEDRAHQAQGKYSALQNLRYWWEEANTQERELFEDWINTVD